MNYVIGIVVILIGFSVTRYPKDTLGLSDMFRVTGEVEYSDLAITLTQIFGVILMIMGIFHMFDLGLTDILSWL